MADIKPQKRLRRPRAVKVDDKGRMFIPEYGLYRAQVYEKDAAPLLEEDIIAMPRSASFQVT